MRRLLAATAALALAVFVSGAGAPVGANPDSPEAAPLEPQTQNGIRFLSGGIGRAEQGKLRELDDDYNLRLVMSRTDGAYLSDVRVTLRDAAGSTLVDTETRGPIFLARLDPGRYRLEARFEDGSEERVIDVPRDREQVRLYVALAGSTPRAGR